MQPSELKGRAGAVRKTHCYLNAVSLENSAYKKKVINFFINAIKDDMGPSGDISSRLIGDIKSRKIDACIFSKDEGIAAGLGEIGLFLGGKYAFLKGNVSFEAQTQDGKKIKRGQVLAHLKGYACDILLLERTLLNFIQRMSGIATLTKKWLRYVPSHVLLTSTRKTCLGILDKKAVTAGGGGTHRINLPDALLIKDNHMNLFKNDFTALFKALVKAKEKGRFVEIEVKKAPDALKIVRLYEKYRGEGLIKMPIYIMLDNMKPDEIRDAVAACRKISKCENIYFEASGGISGKNVKHFAKSGVDIISSGALTHSPRALDISLEIRN